MSPICIGQPGRSISEKTKFEEAREAEEAERAAAVARLIADRPSWEE